MAVSDTGHKVGQLENSRTMTLFLGASTHCASMARMIAMLHDAPL